MIASKLMSMYYDVKNKQFFLDQFRYLYLICIHLEYTEIWELIRECIGKCYLIYITISDCCVFVSSSFFQPQLAKVNKRCFTAAIPFNAVKRLVNSEVAVHLITVLISSTLLTQLHNFRFYCQAAKRKMGHMSIQKVYYSNSHLKEKRLF